MGKMKKARNPYVNIGGTLYVVEPAIKSSASRKVYDAIKSIWKNPSAWSQANQVEDIVFMAMAEAAVRAVRAWDLGKTGVSDSPGPIKGNKEPISNAVKKAVRLRSFGYCEIQTDSCTRDAVNIHHIVPRSLGGSNRADNLQNACLECHRRVHEGFDDPRVRENL